MRVLWAVCLLALAWAWPAAAATERVALPDGTVVTLTENLELFLEATPEPGEGMLHFSRRLCGSETHASRLSQENGGVRRLLNGVRYRVPFELLTAERQADLLRQVFGEDGMSAEGWSHRVGGGSAVLESLWGISEWFTGYGGNYRAIRDFNQLADDHLEPGQRVVIPAALLRPALRAVLPSPPRFHLEYGEDGRGEYALYRLAAGEALYSSVVVRFTGRVFADDVNALASTIAERSAIRDVTDIPVGYGVKVPFDLLQPEYLPAGHPRRQEYERGLLASSQFSNPVRVDRLRGITVLLDSGHGGTDVGASLGGVWESVYVYDIMLRVRALLLASTGATVVPTIRDGRDFRVPDNDRLGYSRAHSILTNPEYAVEDSTIALHLRWYLANSVFQRAVRDGGDRARVVFLSIHADSLHPSLRGAMAYIPGASYTAGSYSRSGSVYSARAEYRDRPQVSFSSSERVQSEGLSRDLAQHIIASFRRGGLAVHPDKPIRDKVIRQRRSWVPAVIRFNAVPAKLLLEVCNLANTEDRRLLQTREFRQRVAEAIVAGIVDYYGDGESSPGLRVAASR
jgi:N-acetylmuramoyl-L-alanine amidase